MQYVEIKDAILEQIEAGMLLPREKLPAERKLATSFNTTRITLREALSLLEAQGKIYREDRRGWFISPPPLRYDLTERQHFTNMALSQDREPKTQFLNAKIMVVNKQAAQLLALKPFSNVYCVDRLRFLEDRPVMYVRHYIRCDLFPNLLKLDLSNSLTELYRQHFDIVSSSFCYQIRSSSLLGETAKILRATIGTSAMVLERVIYNVHQEVIASDIEYWRQDAINIESQVVFTD